MSHLELDAAQMAARKLEEFAPGTLVMIASQARSATGPFWAIRFDESVDGNVRRGVIWLNGTPWSGMDTAFYVMSLDGDDLLGIGCGPAQIKVDVASATGRNGAEMSWEQSAGFVTVGSNGAYLLGKAPRQRGSLNMGYAVDVLSWSGAPDASRQMLVEWFGRWKVVVDTTGCSINLPFDARSKSATLTASTR